MKRDARMNHTIWKTFSYTRGPREWAPLVRVVTHGACSPRKPARLNVLIAESPRDGPTTYPSSAVGSIGYTGTVLPMQIRQLNLFGTGSRVTASY